MIESELGDWRRTHYSNQLGSDLEESIVTIMGWVSTVRGHGNISFDLIINCFVYSTDQSV